MIRSIGRKGAWLVALLVVLAAATADADTRDQWYVLTDVESGRRIGARHLIMETDDDEVEFTEKVSVQQGLGTVGYAATVTYHCRPRVYPMQAETRTFIDGEEYMDGAVEFENGMVTMTSVLHDEHGQPITPRQSEDAALPEGSIVLFPQGLEVVAPQLLTQDRELEGVLFAEFPATSDVLLDIGAGHRLVRSRGDRPGWSRYQLFPGPEARRAIWEVQLDEDGTPVRGRFYSTRFLAASKAEALEPVTEEATEELD